MASPRLQQHLQQPPRDSSSYCGVPVDALENAAACTESSVPPTAAIAIPPLAYSTKIVQQQATIGVTRQAARRQAHQHPRSLPSSTTITQQSDSSNSEAAAASTATAFAASTITTTVTTSSSISSNKRSSSNVTQRTSTQPSTVSLTGSRQTQPLNTIPTTVALRELTHCDTAEYRQTKHSHREVRMVWPTDLTPYDLFDGQDHYGPWNGEPIPIDDVDHVFDTTSPDYSIPAHYPHPHYPQQQQQQQQYPPLEQAQVGGTWSREEQATMDRLIEDAMDEEPLEEFDLDRLDELLGEEQEERQIEDEPLAEFFPMLGSSNSALLPVGSVPSTSSSVPIPTQPQHLTQPMYHEMVAAAPAVAYDHQTTMMAHTTTSSYDGTYGTGCAGEWLRMGAPDGRIDRSPTFMDTGCDIDQYLNNDWYDEPSTSRSTPDYDAYQPPAYNHHQAPSVSPPVPAVHVAPAAAAAARAATTRTMRATRTTRTTTTTVRYAPYTAAAARKPAPAKRQPVFRPEGFGTPAIGENEGEYRKRRDKNNISSARSRAKKAEALKEMKVEAVQLEKKNIELKAVLDSLEREVSYYKELMMTALSK